MPRGGNGGRREGGGRISRRGMGRRSCGAKGGHARTLVAVHKVQHQACIGQLSGAVGQARVPVGGRVDGLAALAVQDLAAEVGVLAGLKGALAHCDGQRGVRDAGGADNT